MPTAYDELTGALDRQLATMVSWLRFVYDELDNYSERPSSLDGWNIRQLVVHIGASMDALLVAEPVPVGTVPLSLAEYLGTYPNRAQEIEDGAVERAQQLTTPLLEFVSSQHRKVQAKLADLGNHPALVMQGKRGPITLRDLVVSRLIEAVVHSLDLVKSLKNDVDMSAGKSPLDKGALNIVAQELLDIVVTRGGYSLEVSKPDLWISLATGRTAYNTDELTAALAPKFTAGGVPDLGTSLPLL